MRPFQATALRPQRARPACEQRGPDPLRAKGLQEMNRTRNTLYLALLSALFLFAGMLTLRAAAAQQSGDQTDSSSTKKPSESKQTPPALLLRHRCAQPAPTNAPAARPQACSGQHSRCFQARGHAANSSSEQLRHGLGQYGFRHLSQARHALLRQDQAGQIHVGSRRHQGRLSRCREEIAPVFNAPFFAGKTLIHRPK